MYTKFKYFSINPQGGFNEALLDKMTVSDKGLEAKPGSIAIYYSLSFDSQENGCIWHKIRVWGDVPEGMHYEMSYFASDNKEFIRGEKDIDIYMLDKNKDSKEKLSQLDDLWENREIDTKNHLDNGLNEIKILKKDLVNIEDALLINAVGRYLWIRIKVDFNYVKNIEQSIVLKKIRLYYPRMSFLSYLPAVYQEDAVSRDFLERFLSVFSTIHDEMEENIDNISQYFDPDFAQGEYLKWLSTWLAISSDDRWSQETLRQLLKRAPEIYKMRGTRRAIEDMIEIYTGAKPKIVEYFEYKDLLEDPKERENLVNLYGDDPYTFTVIVRQEQVRENHQKMALKKILAEEKPAYTEVRLVVLKNNIELGNHTYIGENSRFTVESGLVLDPERSVLYYNKLEDYCDEMGEEG